MNIVECDVAALEARILAYLEERELELEFHVGAFAYQLGKDRYVRRDDSSKILGRVSGNQDGAYWYQIAAKPYDELSVCGFATLNAAFAAMVNELERRRKRDARAAYHAPQPAAEGWCPVCGFKDGLHLRGCEDGSEMP